MKCFGVLIGVSLFVLCVVVLIIVLAGQFEIEFQFSVNLFSDWLCWLLQINLVINGEYLIKDGMLLNWLYFIIVVDGGMIVWIFCDSEVLVFQVDVSEFEFIELVICLFEQVGYNLVEVDDICLVVIDGEDGLCFLVIGNWENGFNVCGDVVVVMLDDELNVIFFMVLVMYYYGEFQFEVDMIILFMDLVVN